MGVKNTVIKWAAQAYLNANILQSLNDKYSDEYLQKKWKKRPSCIVARDAREIQRENGVWLSFIVPLYNSEPYMRRCIESLLTQKTSFDYEIILVNDGSVDSTELIMEEYREKYPKIIILLNQENQGISAARNAGLNVAKGKYVSFVDHDDWIAEDYVEKLISVAVNENADIVKCGFEEKTVSGEKNLYQTKYECVIGEMRESLYKYSSYIWGGVYARKLFEYISFPVGYWFEDMIVRFLLYRQSHKFINTGEILYCKLVHENNASVKVWNNRNYKSLEQVYLVEELIDASKKIGLVDDVYLYRCILHELSYTLEGRIRKLDHPVKKQAFLKAREILLSVYNEKYYELLNASEREWHDALMHKRYFKWLALARI